MVLSAFSCNLRKAMMSPKLNVVKSNYDAWALWCMRDYKSLNVMYSGVLYLMELLMVFPLSAAVVERLFSRMKLVKTCLRNQMLTDTLSKQVMIGRRVASLLTITSSRRYWKSSLSQIQT